MKIKTLFLTFCLCCYSMVCQGQLRKGTWSLGGTVSMVNTQTDFSNRQAPVSSTFLTLNPQVSLMISDRWMLGAALQLDFSDQLAVVAQTVHFRHYFKTVSQTSFFWGGEVEWEKRRPIEGISTSFKPRRFFRSKLKLGVDHFLNRNIALEAFVDYHFLEMELASLASQPNNVSKGEMRLVVKMSLFFDSKLKEETVNEVRNFQKGMWMIGGQIALSVRNGNVMEPELARFFSSRLALGARFSYSDDFNLRLFTFGLQPFARYYLPLGKKKKLFTELGFGFGVDVLHNRNELEINRHNYKGNLSLGLANMLSKNASFDIILFYDTGQIKGKTNSWTRKNIGLALALQSYFGRSN